MNRKTGHISIIMLPLLLLTLVLPAVSAEENTGDIPDRKGISIAAGRTYSPTNDIDTYMVSGFIMYDYDKVWKHKAPEPLRFKVEGSIGAAHENKTRMFISGNIFALYYLDKLKSRTFKPYIEGGIGIIYTDFQVKGQGLRINFNPQIGLGTEIKTKKDDTFYMAVRLHHISNANLDDDNVGVNTVMCMFGYYF